MSKRSTLFKIVERALADEDTTFGALAEGILNEGGNADDVMFEVRKLTAVPVTTRTVQRWVEAFVA